jgi:glucose-1-phosphate thymidylyltransferase
MDGELVVAFADTLFRADFSLDHNADGVIWVKQVDNPKAFGVVELAADGTINNFVEKPQEFISDLAIIGIYHFKNGGVLRDELQYLLDNDIKDKGEYQLTNALDNMKNKGMKFKPGTVDAWMDCGNKEVTLDTNNRMLDYLNGSAELRGSNINLEKSVIIEPCYIGNNVTLRNATVGPHVSLGSGTVVENATVQKSLVQHDTVIKNINLNNSMLGANVVVDGSFTSLSLGDFCRME